MRHETEKRIGNACCTLAGQPGPASELSTSAAHCSSFACAVAWLAWGAALRESVTFDELAHVGAGLSYWQTLDLRLNEEHPPLAKLLAGLPLALTQTQPTTLM